MESILDRGGRFWLRRTLARGRSEAFSRVLDGFGRHFGSWRSVWSRRSFARCRSEALARVLDGFGGFWHVLDAVLEERRLDARVAQFGYRI